MIDWKGQQGQDIANLWNEGKSANYIGKKFGIKRNVICGGVARLRARGMIMRDKVDAQDVWSREQIETMKTLWGEGRSASQISEAIGRSFSGVKGKIDRMARLGQIQRRIGMSGPKPSGIRAPRKPPSKKSEVYGVKQMTLPVRRDEARIEGYTLAGLSQVEKFDARMTNEGIPLLEIRAFQCRFPTSNSWPWLMCGERVSSGSYCLTCAARVNGRIAA